MSLSRIKVWIPGEVLTAADLNGEFNNILTNPQALNDPLVFPALPAPPGPGTAGRVYYNSVTQQIEVDDGTFIRAVPTVKSTTLSIGDVVVATTAGNFINSGLDGGFPSFDYSMNNTGAAVFAAPLL